MPGSPLGTMSGSGLPGTGSLGIGSSGGAGGSLPGSGVGMGSPGGSGSFGSGVVVMGLLLPSVSHQTDTAANLQPPWRVNRGAGRLAASAAPIVAVVGATASGKSDLALDLAERLGGEILNTDAMAVYRGMDIGTAKLPPPNGAASRTTCWTTSMSPRR